MAETLRERLIGAWKLVSYVEKPVNGSVPLYPMGEAPQGLILYTPDGHMSAQLMRPSRRPFSSDDWFRASDEEVREEALGDIAYSGRFQTGEAKPTQTHSMHVSLFPNWLGQTQLRVVRIKGDVLNLSSAAPILSGGKQTMSYLSLQRAEPSAGPGHELALRWIARTT